MPNSNTLTNVIPQILAQGLMALRGFTVMPRLVNLDYGNEAKEKGDTIDVPIPSAITAVAVTSSNTPPDDAGVEPTKVQIPLDQWYEAPFFMSDKDMHNAMSGTVPMQVTAAVKAVADKINETLFAQYKGIYGYVGTAGTTPFAADTTAATGLRKVLNNQSCPKELRRAVLDPDAAANALGLRAFQDQSFRGDDKGIKEGEIGRKLGFDWYEDQVVPSHTTGAAGTVLVDQADVAIGDSSAHFDGLTTVPSVGDVFTVAGDDQTYTVTAATALVGTDSDVTFAPAAKVAWADNAAVTFKASHTVNLGFHRDAFALAMRPLAAPNGFTGGSEILSMVDPLTGLTLRLEVSRQHKRTRWSFDALWGVKLVRPELAARLAG